MLLRTFLIPPRLGLVIVMILVQNTAHQLPFTTSSHTSILIAAVLTQAVFAAACSEGVKATAREVCGIDTNGSTNYFICIAGEAAFACRSQAQGVFGNDCTGSCVIQ